MSKNYNSILQSNNTDLQAILTTINELPNAGGGDPVLQDKTVTPTTSQQTITADSNYDGLSKVTVNAMPTATQATPAITVNASGLITATATQTAGYVTAGSKSATKQLAFQAAKTITPTTASQIAVSSGYYTGGSVTVAGDSNLVAGNIKSGVSIFGVNGTYVGSGGDTSMEDGLIMGTISSYVNDRVTCIDRHAFYNNWQLKSVDFPVCTTIGSSAFYNCYNLTAANFPVCTTIGTSAFYSCYLTTAYFPACTKIYTAAFSYCRHLTTASFPVCTTIGEAAFYNCSNLTTASFPVCTTIGEAAFYNCDNLTTANFPACTKIGYEAFRDLSKLTSVNFPACTTIGSVAFSNCRNLTTASFPVCTTIGNSAFMYCYRLSAIYIGTNISTVCNLQHSNALAYANFSSSYTGSIFVPASLVNAYKTATNWTYYSSRIFAAP